MSYDDQLTILLTLKDRTAFTLRWMSYADGIHFPFKVLIADGGLDESVPVMFRAPSRFPNVKYEYVRYPIDRSYSDYYAKVVDALGRVETPFVAMADNDDFLTIAGLIQSVEFLLSNSQYVTCGGQCAIFWVGTRTAATMDDRLYGDHIDWKYVGRVQSNIGESARQRLLSQSLIRTDSYYHVRRTAELRARFETVRDLGLRDLFLTENLISFLTSIDGKQKQLKTLYLARQHNAPGSSASEHQQRYGDWFGRMLVPSWSEDFRRFVSVTAAALAEADNISIGEATDFIIRSYRRFTGPVLLCDILEASEIPTYRSLMVDIVRRAVKLPRQSLVRKALQALYRRTRWVAAGAVFGEQLFATPVSGAGQEIRVIKEYLSGRGAPE